MFDQMKRRYMVFLAVNIAAIMIGLATGQLTLSFTVHHDLRAGQCLYGGQSVANGAAVTSSVPGIDALCQDGTMTRYIPGK